MTTRYRFNPEEGVEEHESGAFVAYTELEKANATIQKQADNIEVLRMQLVACGVAAMSNTKTSIEKTRIDKENTYWSASYDDVCRAVDAEIEYREELESVQNELTSLRLVKEALEWHRKSPARIFIDCVVIDQFIDMCLAGKKGLQK